MLVLLILSLPCLFFLPYLDASLLQGGPSEQMLAGSSDQVDIPPPFSVVVESCLFSNSALGSVLIGDAFSIVISKFVCFPTFDQAFHAPLTFSSNFWIVAGISC